MFESAPWLAPAMALLPLLAGTGLLAVAMGCERSRVFAQLVKYGSIGLVATWVQTAIFYVLASTCLACLAPDDWAVRLLGLTPVEVADGVRAWRFAVATSIGFAAANVLCWLLNRGCVFRPGRFRWQLEFAMFFGVSLLATLAALAISAVLIRWAGLMTTIAVGVEILASFMMNYFVRKFFIFGG